MRNDSKLDVYWPLVDKDGNEANFYTRYIADIYLEIATGKEYTRGKIKTISTKMGIKPKYPPLIEEGEAFRFYKRPVKKEGRGPTVLEEIYISNLLDSLFKKK